MCSSSNVWSKAIADHPTDEGLFRVESRIQSPRGLVVYQNEHGLIDQDVFDSTISQMRELLIDTPGGSSFWQGRRHMYTEAMRTALEQRTSDR